MLFVAFCFFNISALIVTFPVVFRRLCSFSIVILFFLLLRLFFSALNRCFSYCLLSFPLFDGLFYVICLSLPLNVVSWRFSFLHFRIINLGFPRFDGLFFVICLSLPLFAQFCVFLTFFCALCALLVFFSLCLLGFSCLDDFFSFF